MSHTKKNLRDVEDAAIRFGLSDTQEARFARRDLEMKRTGLTYLSIKPGRREAFAHRHREAEEVYARELLSAHQACGGLRAVPARPRRGKR